MARWLLVALLAATEITIANAPPGSAPRQLSGQVIALLAEGKIIAVDVASGEIVAERVASTQPRYELRYGRLARRPPAYDEIFAVLPDGTAPVLTAFHLKTRALRRVAQLPAGEYRGLAVGAATGRVYAFGEMDSFVLVVDPATGTVLQRLSDGTGRDNYSGAVSPDERRIFVSYHGNASGVGVFDVAGDKWRYVTTIRSHGNFVVVGDTVLAATGDQTIIEVDHKGQKLREIPTLLHGNHLMEFALDYKRRIYAVGSCMYAGGFSRTEPGAGTHVMIPVGPGDGRLPRPVFEVCGERISVTADGALVAVAPLRTAVTPSASRPGTILVLGGISGALFRTIKTSSEAVDVLAIR